MSRILCVANWSEGRNQQTLQTMRDSIRSEDVEVHFLGADEDHNRLVTAFSGSLGAVRSALLSAAEVAFSKLDMARHEGVHPRIGALDVCPFIVLQNSVSSSDALAYASEIAKHLADEYAIPIFLYEKSETGKHSADLPSLRKGQYEGLLGRPLNPDFGPMLANPRLGATVVGVRDWLLAANINLPFVEPNEALRLVREIRLERDKGNVLFTGVRALGLKLERRGLSQVSMNLTRPDATTFDDIYAWVATRTQVQGTELVGVIRPQDLSRARALVASPEQIVLP